MLVRRATRGRISTAAPAQRWAMSRLTWGSLFQSSVPRRICCSNARRWRLSPSTGEIEDLSALQLRVGQTRQVGDAQSVRIRAEQDVHAIHAQDLERGAAHGLEHRLRVERLAADALVERRQRACLLVVETLGLQVPGSLDRHADLATDRLQEAQLGLVEGAARRGRHVQDAAARAVEGERHAGVGDRRRDAGDDRRHARTVGPVEGLAGLAAVEDAAAQALADAAGPELVQVRGRDAAVRREAQALVLVVLQEDPGGVERQTVEDGVEGTVQDGLHVLLAVQAQGDVGQDRELALPTRDGGPQLTQHGRALSRRVTRHRFREGCVLRKILRHRLYVDTAKGRAPIFRWTSAGAGTAFLRRIVRLTGDGTWEMRGGGPRRANGSPEAAGTAPGPADRP